MKISIQSYWLLLIVLSQIFTGHCMIAPNFSMDRSSINRSPLITSTIPDTTTSTTSTAIPARKTSTNPFVFNIGGLRDRKSMLDEILSQKSKWKDMFASRTTEATPKPG